MHDEKKSADDFDEDFLDDEDDFDFGDLDDETSPGDGDDDLGDDSWDEFDDIPDAEINESAGSKTPDNNTVSTAKQPVKKKSFAGKNFNLIIISIAVLGGGGLFLSQTSNTPDEASSSEAPADIMAEMPTAEAPTSALPDTNLGNGSDIIKDDFFKGPEELAGQVDTQERESITVDIDEAPPMPVPMSSSPQQQAASSTPEPSRNEVLTPMPEMAALSEQQQLASLDEPLEEAPVEKEGLPAVSPEPQPELQVTDTSEPPAPPVSLDPAPVATPTPEATIDPTVNITAVQNEENAVQSEEMERKIQDLEKRLADATISSDELSSKISEKDNKISELNVTIAALEERIATLSKPVAPPPAPPENKESETTEKKQSAPIAQPTVKPKKIPSSTKSTSSDTTLWKLRSAQPGKALVSEQGSSDFKTINVGDTLKGIGRIVSIDVEDGKWVVTGTQGRISQ